MAPYLHIQCNAVVREFCTIMDNSEGVSQTPKNYIVVGEVLKDLEIKLFSLAVQIGMEKIGKRWYDD